MKSLRLLSLFLIIIGLSQNIAAQKTIYDDNVQVRNLASFEALSVGSAIEVYLSQDVKQTVAVGASDEKSRDAIITEIRGNTLFVDFKNGWNNLSAKRLRVYIAINDLKKITLSGACNILIEEPFKANDLEVSLSGASDFRGAVKTQNLKLSASGSSDYHISGWATNLRIQLSGSSDLKGYDLIADNCEINTSGASDVQITVNKEMKVKSSGASDVSYKGTATVRSIESSGASSVKRKD